jgi:FixJ family two-component response regulator
MDALISIVDDDEGIRTSLSRLIRSAGYRVAMFESAESFLDSATMNDSQCVITDIGMPGGMDGLELLREMRRSEKVIPVILISSFLEGRMFEEALAAEPHCLLKKPFDGDRLIACIESAIRR